MIWESIYIHFWFFFQHCFITSHTHARARAIANTPTQGHTHGRWRTHTRTHKHRSHILRPAISVQCILTGDVLTKKRESEDNAYLTLLYQRTELLLGDNLSRGAMIYIELDSQWTSLYCSLLTRQKKMVSAFYLSMFLHYHSTSQVQGWNLRRADGNL